MVGNDLRLSVPSLVYDNVPFRAWVHINYEYTYLESIQVAVSNIPLMQ